MRLVVHVDGGSRGNPGPAAAAAVTSTPDGDVVDETAVVLGRTTNNVAEYRALLLGLERARALGATEVEVVNDSELVANQVNGRYRVKSPEMAALHGDVMRALEGFARWEVRPVPRAENVAADALVNQALDAAGDAADGEPTEYAGYLRIDDLLRLQEPLDRDHPAQARRGDVRPPGPQLVPGGGELVQDQLEPQLVGLVDDDEQQLVVGRRVTEGLLGRQQPVEMEVGPVVHGLSDNGHAVTVTHIIWPGGPPRVAEHR